MPRRGNASAQNVAVYHLSWSTNVQTAGVLITRIN